MTGVLMVFVLGLALMAALVAGVGVAWRARSPVVIPALARSRDGLVALWGPVGAAVAVAASGLTLILLALWPIGAGLARLESSVDKPVYDWMQDRLTRHSWWTEMNRLLTQMGNNRETQAVCVVASVALAVLWRRRSWWIPPVAIIGTYWGLRFAQQLLSVAVHRGHPPTTLGTYPSGGCARLIGVGGIVLLLVGLTFPRLTRPWRLTAWGLLALAAYIEGYSRTYLLKHWVTDVIGGWLLGLLVLAVFAAATMLLCARSPASPRPGEDEHQHERLDPVRSR